MEILVVFSLLMILIIVSLAQTQEEVDPLQGVIESPIMIAVKMGMDEMVKKILETFSEASRDKDSERKNILLLAVEHRQLFTAVLIGRSRVDEKLDEEVDAEGNSILHLAAKYPHNQGPVTTDAEAASRMYKEIVVFNFFKKELPPYFSNLLNHKGQTASEVFTETHQQLAIQRAKWLDKASQSFSVVATLIISVVFATISTVPGGLMQDQGPPVYRGKLAFNIFSVASLFAMCFSSISLTMFLYILSSPHLDNNIGNYWANKFTHGLCFLSFSIMAMFFSFFSGNLFVLDSKMKYIAYPIYGLTSCVVIANFPLYSVIVKNVVAHIRTRYSHKY